MNNVIFFKLYSIAHQSNFLDKIIVFCADYLPYLAILGVMFFILYHYEGDFDWRNPFRIIRQRFIKFFLIFTPAVIGWILVTILKDVFSSPRPFIKFGELVNPLFTHGGMDSFPSGHATFFGALALSMFLVNKKMGYFFIFFAIIIGLARIISGIHFPVDILSGYLLGVAIVIIFNFVSNKKSKGNK